MQVTLNINSIQFPDFAFSGIDATIEHHQETYQIFKGNKEQKKEGADGQGFCESDDSYKKRAYEEVPKYEDVERSFYEVDLYQTYQAIRKNIDNQSLASIDALKRIVEKQIFDDFRSAEQQINHYIKKFQDEFDSLLKERETRESEKMQIRATLELQKVKLNEYSNELAPLRASLDSWKPKQIPIMLG